MNRLILFFQILDLSSKQMHRIKAEENGLYASCATNIDDRIVLSVGRVINVSISD